MIRIVCKIFGFVAGPALLTLIAAMPSTASKAVMPFAPGESLAYQLHWGNIPAGRISFEVKSLETINGTAAYHFVMTTHSNGFVDIFYKIRERIDAYADAGMMHSLFYKKRQTAGEHPRDAKIEFNWQARQAQYSNFGDKHPPIDLMPGSFDPLSAFYYTRMALNQETGQIERPVTDGKKNFMGRAKIIGRESITLSNGKQYETFCLAPDMGLFSGIFKKSDEPTLLVWVTADAKRIPVRIKTKVSVGHFIGELVSARY